MKKNSKQDTPAGFFNSFRYAFRGIGTMVLTQRNAKIHVILALAAIVMGFWLEISPAEWLFIIFSIGFVISAELFNTSIEKLTDLAKPEEHPVAGQVKDLAAGGVLIAAMTAAAVGLVIFIPHMLDLL